MKNQVKNILVIRNDRFGEFLLILPALRALKETYPQARITLAVDSYIADLAGAIEGVSGVIIWENRKHSFREIISFGRKIREIGFDAAIVFNPTKDSHLACFLAKIPMRIGYSRKWGFLLTHRIYDRKNLALKHEIEYNLDLVALAGAFTNDKSPKLKIADTNFPELLKDSPLIAIHPWTSDKVKQWPLVRFKELIMRLSGFNIVIVGGKEEFLDGNYIGLEFANDASQGGVDTVQPLRHGHCSGHA